MILLVEVTTQNKSLDITFRSLTEMILHDNFVE